MNKLDVLKAINFGQSVAEEEVATLEKYFVKTNQWQNVFKGEVDIVYGPKGAGKSAIYSLIEKNEPSFFQENVRLRFAENPRGATAFSDLKVQPPPSERAFINLWKLYILALIGEHFQEYGVATPEGREVIDALKNSRLLPESNPLKVILGKAKDYVLKYFNPSSFEPNTEFDQNSGNVTGFGCKITFNEPSQALEGQGVRSVDTFLIKANEELRKSNFKIWFLLDRLDVAFADSPELEENALRALFKTYLDLNGYEFIKLKIFLRSDIWKRITQGGFREATHITRCTTLDWDRSTLLNLIVQRFLSNPEILQFYNIESKNLPTSISEQEEFFYRIFPRQVDTGKNPSTLDWIIGRTSDSSGLTAPREIINLINGAKIEQIKSLEIGQDSPASDNLFTRSSLKKGLEFASKEKTEKFLYAEYPSLRKYFDLLKDGKSRYSLENLSKLFNSTQAETLKIADQIVETGLWRNEKRDSPEYWIVFIFRDGLNIVQGTAEDID